MQISLMFFFQFSADEVAGRSFDPQEAQVVMWVGGAVHEHLALVHDVAVMHQNVFLLGDQELMGIAVEIGDDQTLLARGVFTERGRTGDFGQHTGVFRGTGFEQFSYPWQTAGDVACFLRFLWNTRQHFADTVILTVSHGRQCANRPKLALGVGRVVASKESLH